MTSPEQWQPSSSALRRALRRARDGVALDLTEAGVLLAARGDELTDLMASAARVRDAGLEQLGRPGTVTYSRKVFIPLTRLCRDRCHYCTFATAPHKLAAPFLSLDEVLAIARDGAALGCKEALFTLGDRPEDRWPQARDWLDAAGYDSTLAYVRAAAIAVLEETGLLPHLNPGVLSWQELQRLKPVAPSLGMMLETSSRRLFETPGEVHYGSPDKDPAVRLRTLEDAGRSAVAFTTGVLVGIGETREELAQSLLDIRASARRHGHVQEVIVQNFRAKPDTAARGRDDADREEHLAAVAVARLLLGPTIRVQAPPNLVEPGDVAALLAAGVDDLGGVSPLTPDHVNPERPWPQLDDLAAWTAAAGFTLTERLAAHPRYLAEPWLDPRLAPHVAALADPANGLAAAGAMARGLPWQEPDGGLDGSGRTDLHVGIDLTGRSAERRGDFDAVYGDWAQLAGSVSSTPGAPALLAGELAAALRQAAADPTRLSDAQALALFHADGADLDALCSIADDLRAAVVGEEVTFVNTRNINFTNVCYTGCRFCAFAQRRTDPGASPLSRGEHGDRAGFSSHPATTEICMQGGIHPDLPGTAYFDLARAVKARVPQIHLHAFSPMEVVNGASRTGMSYPDFLTAAREAGVDSIPGTAAEILDDEVRWVLTKGKLPAATWVEVITAAHKVGLRSSSTMMYGHVDTPAHWLAHLRLLGRIQAETGGFTEFVPLPFVHTSAPLYLAGIARPGPTLRDNRAVHAMARLLLHGLIDHVQTSWVKLGVDGTRVMLAGGADDLGGTLMEETISRMAGSQHGSAKTVEELTDIAAGIGRPVRQRTTLYGSYDRAPGRSLPLAVG